MKYGSSGQQRIGSPIRHRLCLCAGGLRERIFFEKQNRGLGVKFFGSQLRALPGAERRSLEAVLIHKRRARLVPV